MTTTMQQDQRAPADHLLDALERAYFRYRHVVAPPLAAAFLWTSSALAWATTGWSSTVPLLGWPFSLGWWPLGLYLAAVVVWLLLVASDIVRTTERVPLWGEDKPGERADESRWANTRVVAALAWGYAAVWAVVQAWAGPSTETVGMLVVFLLPAWVYWSQARTVRRGVEVFRDIEKWDGAAVGLAGLDAKPSGARAAADGSWWEWPLVPAVKGTFTASMIRKVLPRIAARYEVTAAELEVEEPTPGRYVLRYAKANPNEAPVMFTLPPTTYSVRQRAVRGRWDDDGTPMLTSLYRDDHGGVDGLGIGVKGGGKSNNAEMTAAYAVAAKDAILWVADLKPGAQQWGPWADACDWLATSPAEVDQMGHALLAIMQVRGGQPGRIVKPSPKRPAIIVVIDEAALYFNEAATPGDYKARQVLQARVALWENVLAVSRSFGISVRMYVQRAIWDSIGGATIRGHLLAGEAVIFRTAKNEDARLAIDVPADQADALRTSEIPRTRAGTCLVLNADNEEPRRGREFLLTEAARDELVARDRDRQPPLEDAARRTLGDVYENRRRLPRAGEVARAGDVVDVAPEEPADLEDLPRREEVAPRQTESESIEAVWLALTGFEPRGGTVKKVAAAVGKSEPLTRTRLNQLVTLGAARKEGKPQRYLTLGTVDALRGLLAAGDDGTPAG